MPDAFDLLEEMTKAELIDYIRRDTSFFYNPPKKSNLLFARWSVKTEAIRIRRDKNQAYINTIDLKTRDELARKHNASVDGDERMAILEKMTPYEDSTKKFFDENMAINKAQEKVDKLYKQYLKESEKERKCY